MENVLVELRTSSKCFTAWLYTQSRSQLPIPIVDTSATLLLWATREFASISSNQNESLVLWPHPSTPRPKFMQLSELHIIRSIHSGQLPNMPAMLCLLWRPQASSFRPHYWLSPTKSTYHPPPPPDPTRHQVVISWQLCSSLHFDLEHTDANHHIRYRSTMLIINQQG